MTQEVMKPAGQVAQMLDVAVAESQLETTGLPLEGGAITPLPIRTASELQEYYKHTAPPEPVIEGVIRKGEVGMIGGRAKCKKSLLATQIAFGVAQGKPVFGLQTKETKVAIIDFELSPHNAASRCQMIGGNLEGEDRVMIYNFIENFDDPFYIEQVTRRIEAQPRLDDVGLFIFDPLYHMVKPGTEIDNGAMTAVMRHLKRFAIERNVAVLVVHHFPKGDRSGHHHPDQVAGSSAIGRAIESLITVNRHAKGADCTTLAFTARHNKEPEARVIRWVGTRFVLDATVEPNERESLKSQEQEAEMQMLMLSMVPSEGIASAALRDKAMETLGISKSCYYNYRGACLGRGELEERNGKLYRKGSDQPSVLGENEPNETQPPGGIQ
ncbi:MAG: hypothetical protein CMO55_23110 [Verrucomicrobiales bacterium]|nr:hypothetical protein [Verrucomicrobiales bacterium]